MDQEAAGRIAAEQAVCKAGDNIGLVINPTPFLGLTQRGTAISRTCQEYGVDIHSRTFYCENDIDAGYELGIRMIRSHHLHLRHRGLRPHAGTDRGQL